jgi:homocysteine S-methyltransferase
MTFALDRTLLLDGGLSNQLEAQGCDLGDRLWTARVLRDQPEAIVEAHLAYLGAGASVIITASYQADTPALLKRSVELAREAVSRAGAARPLWVAASVGPYGAMLADGSEYRGRYGLTRQQLRDFHRPRLEALAAASPDVLALETVPDVLEAEALLEIAGDLGLPAWLTYSAAAGITRAGQPLAEAFALTRDLDFVVGTGVNCCAPEDALEAVRIAAAVTGKPVVVYPNSGEAWDAEARAFRGKKAFSSEDALAWQAAGARLIGGCCRVGPDVIRQLATRLA